MGTNRGCAYKVGGVQEGRDKVASSMGHGAQRRWGSVGEGMQGGAGCVVFGRTQTEWGSGWLML